jgi:radical SAM superfamily enzyme YgiQ (UPF0313 family)
MQKKRYKLLLIKPKQRLNHYSTQIEIARILGKPTNSVPLALPLIAGLTPDHYDIKIIDEDIAYAPSRYQPDIVGITMITSNSARGYQLAEKYRKAGAKVVLGGPFPSYNVEECLQYGDSIVVGEAELHWKNVLADFENNELKPVYKTEGYIDYTTSVIPRWDLVPTKKMLSINVQASRGCPYNCEFCLTTHLFGRQVRRRNIDDVVNEIKQIPKKNILFVDENFTINKTYSKEMCKALKPLEINWMCQSSVDVADDEELLKEMSESGCSYIIIGFESLKPDSLALSHKHQNNPEKYNEIIEKIQKHGIHVYASFIIGFDNDTHEDMEIFRQFIEQSSFPVFTLSILGTTSGMDLYDRLKKEGRLMEELSKDFFVGIYPVIQYKNFDNRELFEHFTKITKHLYSYEQIRIRTLRMLEKGYFAKERTTKSVTKWQKFKTTFILLYHYLLSVNKHKRGLFFDFISLIRRKKLAISEGASLLLIFEAITRHIRKDEIHRKEYLLELDRIEGKIPKNETGYVCTKKYCTTMK